MHQTLPLTRLRKLLMGILTMAYPAHFAGQIFRLWDFHNALVTPFGLTIGMVPDLFVCTHIAYSTEYVCQAVI